MSITRIIPTVLRFTCLLIATLAILASPSTLFAADVELPYAGRVIIVTGKVEAVDAKGRTRLLRRGLRVYSGETVNTAANSSLRLVMSDRSMLSLDANASIRLDAYQYKPAEPEQDKMSVSLIKGGLRSLTGAIGQRSKDDVSLVTPVATMGIRGTALQIILYEDGGVAVIYDFGSGFATNKGGRFDIDTGGGAKIASIISIPVAYKSPPRDAWDAATVASRVGVLSPERARDLAGQMVKNMNRLNQVLLIAMLEQVPGMQPAQSLGVVEGMLLADPTGAPTILLAATSINRERAPILLRTAVKAGIPAAEAFQAVVFSLINPSKNEIKAVAIEAIKAGITKEEAEEVIKNLTDGGICA